MDGWNKADEVTASGDPGNEATPRLWSDLGWFEAKFEIAHNGDKPSTVEVYWHDLAEDSSGPLTGWNQIGWDGLDNDLTTNPAVSNWQITEVGFGGQSSTVVDSFTYTPEPATLAVLLLGGLVATLRRKR